MATVKNIGYAFSNPALLRAALTHASAQGEHADNERLEFLGDRVLSLAVADLLFAAYPEEEEGSLAKRHTGLVQQKALVKVAKEIDISSHLTLSPGEKKAGGHQKDKILADALEALIGAIYLDGGLAKAEAFINRFWQPMLTAQLLPPEDTKSQLQEWAQAQGLPLPAYRVVKKTGTDHEPVFEVEVMVEDVGKASARASSKRSAEKEAALRLLQKLELV